MVGVFLWARYPCKGLEEEIGFSVLGCGVHSLWLRDESPGFEVEVTRGGGCGGGRTGRKTLPAKRFSAQNRPKVRNSIRMNPLQSLRYCLP